jgi:sugar/nucleoside kinase (ribokinase family)
MAVAWLEEAGVGLRGLARPAGAATACTVAATDRGRRRLALHHAGASVAAGAGAVEVVRAAAVLLTGYHLLPALRGRHAVALLERARTAGGLTAVDLGPAVDPVAGLEELRPVLANADVVLANEHEAAACTAGAGAEALLDATGGAVVVKLGAAGARVLTRTGTTRAAAVATNAASTVGAGDAFDAGLLYALLRGDALERSARFANATAALTLERGGAVAAPRATEVDALLG